MKSIKPFKIISNNETVVQDLLDKKVKVFGCFEDSSTIYQIVSIGTKKCDFVYGSSIYNKVYYTASNQIISIDDNELILFTGSSQGIKTLKKDKKPFSNARANYVGIELEFVSPVSSIVLMEKIVKEKLSNYVTVTYDSSIDVDDEGFGVEIKILAREAIVFQILKKVLNLLPQGSYVNKSCGLHVHLDMRNRDKEKAYESLYKALPYLTNRVDYTRLDNDYCRLNSDDELASFAEALVEDRYQAINPHSYNKHKTLEVRLKESTLNFIEASSWVRDLIDIVNDKKKSRRGVSFFNIRSAANTAA